MSLQIPYRDNLKSNGVSGATKAVILVSPRPCPDPAPELLWGGELQLQWRQ